MAADPQDRPLEAEDGDSNVSYRPAGPAQPGQAPKKKQKLHAKSVAPTGAKEKQRPVSESDVAGLDDRRRAQVLRTERYGPTSGKL